MTHRCVAWGAICCTLLGVWPATAAAQQLVAANANRSHGRPTPRRFVAVIGEVAVGGVHEIRSAHPLLEDIVAQAGGFTSRATGCVRIVRNGRTILDTRTATRQQIHLQPGDVVVATETSSRTAAGVAGATRDSALVEVALMNLIDRPVVLKLRPRHASLPTLLQLLRQHPNVARFVHVVGGGKTARLRSGSVLVFDPRVVDPNRVPELPGPVVPTPAVARSTAQPVSSISQSRSQGPIRQTQGTVADVPRVPSSNARVLSTVPPPKSSPFSTNSEPDLASPNPLRTAAKPADLQKPGAQTQPPLPPNEPAASQDNDLIRKVDKDEFEGMANDAETSLDLMTLFISIFAVLGVLSAAGMLITMARRAVKGEKPSNNSPARRRSRLDQLLHKEFEVVVEPTAIPSGQSFFGRAAGTRRNRLDEEHAAADSQRPHIDTRVKRNPAEPARSPESARPRRGTTIRRTDGPVRPQPPSGEPRAARPANPATSTSLFAEEELG